MHADVHSQQNRAWQVHHGDQPAAAGQHLLALREGQRKVQEQRRLQQPRDYVGPVHNPVEVVELAGVVERIENERYQAENVEVRALGRSPASQQDIQADAQVNQRDQPQSAVKRPIGGSQNQRRFYRDTLANQRVVGFRPHADAIQLPFHSTDISHIAAANGQQPVAGLDSSFLAGAIGIDPLGAQMGAIFYPPNAIVGSKNFTLFLEINPGENDGGNAEERQENGKKPGL